MLDLAQFSLELGILWRLTTILILFFITPKILRLAIPIVLKFRQRSEKSRLQAHIGELRQELSKISQVDDFAKYSKVQRKLRSSSDSMKSILQRDLELRLQYLLVGQALAWLMAIILSFRSLYQLYSSPSSLSINSM